MSQLIQLASASCDYCICQVEFKAYLWILLSSWLAISLYFLVLQSESHVVDQLIQLAAILAAVAISLPKRQSPGPTW